MGHVAPNDIVNSQHTVIIPNILYYNIMSDLNTKPNIYYRNMSIVAVEPSSVTQDQMIKE